MTKPFACSVPASILYKSIAGRYRPVRVADGPITARYRFIKNAYWGTAKWLVFRLFYFARISTICNPVCDYRFTLYSWLSLSRLRLFRITAYLEVKIWYLVFKYDNLTISNKILWKREEIAPKESNFSSFPEYFQYISNIRNKITYSFVKCGCSTYFSSILQNCYGEVRISRCISESLGLRKNESRLYIRIP